VIELYDLPASGNCYRVRLMLALAGVPCRRVILEHGGIAHNEQVGRLNRLREVPVLCDGPVVLRDSQAMLVYIAARYAPDWLPAAPADLAGIQQWLSFSANEIQNGPRYARAITLGLVPGDRQHYLNATLRVLSYLEAHLQGRRWLHADQPTIADVACHPYLCNVEQAGIDMAAYPNIAAWLAALAAMPGYLAFTANP